MTYNKYTWVTGEVITEDKLNHIEDGISNNLDTDISNISNLGKSNLSGLGMPSGRYIDLTLGESGSIYTAPATGWLCLSKVCSANQYIQFNSMRENGNGLLIGSDQPSGGAGYITMPMKRGQETQINYTATGVNYAFRFVYAEGDQ